MMEERKWEDLNRDCLVEIFARVGTESMAMSIPFVCKSWYDATIDPRCWKSIIFPEHFCLDDFVEFVVGRSQRSATSVVFPRYCPVSYKGWSYIAEGCPGLKILQLPNNIRFDYFKLYQIDTLISVVDLIRKEYLTRFSCRYLEEMLEPILIHCKNFVGLDCSHSIIGKEEACLIVQFTPKIKFLIMRSAHLPWMYFLMILKGCREFELVDVSYCVGFDHDDDETLELALHIKSFNCTSSVMPYFRDKMFGPCFFV